MDDELMTVCYRNTALEFFTFAERAQHLARTPMCNYYTSYFRYLYIFYLMPVFILFSD